MFQFTYELRASNGTPVRAETQTEWFSGGELEAGGPLFTSVSREEGEAVIYALDPCLTHTTESMQTIVVVPPGGLAEVFCFSNPPRPYTNQWSGWQKPSYSEIATSPFEVVDHSKPHQRSTNTHSNWFELRYKFAEFDASSE